MSISYSKMKAKNNKNNISKLREQLNEVDKILAQDPDNSRYISLARDIKMKLDLAAVNYCKGAQVRARIKWIEEGEKNSKYFFALEKSRSSRKTIMLLTDENGDSINDVSEIHKNITNYYKDLYTEKNNFNDKINILNDFIEDITIPQLKESDKNLCEEPITQCELDEALKAMKNASAPGCDGLTTEFYKFFWGKIGNMVYQSLHKAFDNGQLSMSQRRAVIVLIHKGKGLVRDKLGNWRPISLTNTDYKILAEALSGRLQTVIKSLIHEDQVGYVRGRNISTIIRLIDDAIETIKFNNNSGAIVALDYCKAFDSVNKNFLLHTLNLYDFGPNFQKWTQVLLANSQSAVQHAGWLSDWFPSQCGIRQGCPLSPLLFILAVEILALKIRQCSSMQGIKLPGQCHSPYLKIAQYADDTTLFVNSRQDLEEAINIVNNFARFSGLHINRNKSEGLWIGRCLLGGLPDVIKWCPKTSNLKILGVFFNRSKPAGTIEENWEPKINAMINKIKQWEKRGLSVMGKVLISKTFLLSKFVYLMQPLAIPEHALKKIDQVLYKFIWKKKFSERKAFEKVKRAVVNADYEQGGLKMISAADMQSSFLIGWVKKILLHKEAKWATFPFHEFNKLGKDLSVFQGNIEIKEILGLNLINSNFWKSILKTWIEFNVNENNIEGMLPECKREEQPLWNNCNLRYKGKVLFYQKWVSAGVYKLGHMFNDNGTFMSLAEISSLVGPSPARHFEYYALLNGLPREWRNKSQMHQVTSVPQFWDKDITSYTNKGIRAKIVALKYSRPCSVSFWERKFNFDYSYEIWSIPFNCSKETRLHCLQWKILHNIYPTSIMLSKMKVRDSQNCVYCPDEVDYIEHFFFYCSKCIPLWKHVENVLMVLLERRVIIDVKSVIFGMLKDDSLHQVERKLVNLSILVAKMCISKFKYGTSVNIIHLFDSELLMRHKQIPFEFRQKVTNSLS